MNDVIFNKLNSLADQAGCPQIKERYLEVQLSIRQGGPKQYAILGDVNAGKSTVINILTGAKRMPVSARTNEHEKIACIDAPEYNCRWVELNSCTYAAEGLVEADSPLWYIDAAIYILSATTPFTQADVAAIKTCLSYGVPCTLALSKLDGVDEAERGEVITYIKAQAERQFGSDTLLILNVKDEAATKQTILSELQAAESSEDIREYMLSVSYAKALKEHIAGKYEAAKVQMQLVTDRQKQAQQTKLDEGIAWDRIRLGVDIRKKKLVDDMSVEMNRLYNDCIITLANKAINERSPKEWWEKSLEREFRAEMALIANAVDKLICTRIAEDRDWLVQTVEQQFGTRLSVGHYDPRPHLDSVNFGVAPQGLSTSRKAKKLAMTGLIASSVALCFLSYPVLAMHSANLLYWNLAGAAAAGTGFWTFMETKKDRAAKLQCLKAEIARYILSSRDENIEALRRNIEYGYNSMKISVQDLQVANAQAPANEADSKVLANFKTVNEQNRQCDEIISSLLSDEE